MKLSRDLGIDLGTSNIIIYSEGKGIVLREPAVVAVEKEHGKILQVGAAARNMMGRTPGNVVAVHPIRGGVVCDYELTQKMLEEFLRKVIRFNFIKPRVIVSVPSGITEVEEKAVIQAMMEAGARRVYLIEAPLAAGLGVQLNLGIANGQMIIDIGGGVTDIAVLSMNAVAVSSSIKAAGDDFDEAIIRYLRKHHEIVIGKNTAEEMKMTIGGVRPRKDGFSMTVKGRDTKSGRPTEVVIGEESVMEAMMPIARRIAEEVLNVLDRTTPELISDISANGIHLTGGCSQIYGMAEYLSLVTQIPCVVAGDPDSCCAYGCGRSINWIHKMNEGSLNLSRLKILKEDRL